VNLTWLVKNVHCRPSYIIRNPRIPESPNPRILG